MITLRIRYGSDAIADAMHKAPDVMERHAEAGLDEAAAKVARLEKQEAPKATTLLTDSIQVRKPSRFIRVIAPGTNYADYVNEGTGIFGPNSRASGRMPPVQSILDWIRVKGIEPNKKGMSDKALAFVIAAGIAKTGTRKNDYVERTAKKAPGIGLASMTKAMQLGLAEVMEA